MSRKRYYFSTRDLLMMAALAALGGITSTYVNAIGDAVQSVVGIAGTTQWAAGLHVVWLTLAMGLVGRVGTGTTTGVLKGVVELMTGNTHGLLVVLVDVVAGLLVDLGFLPFRDKQRPLPFLIAGGLASASNVFVFQLFAALPSDILAYSALFLVGGVAMLSGVIFAGVLGWGLLNALRRAGAVKDQPPTPANPTTRYVAIAAAVVLTGALAFYLRATLKGPPDLTIQGAVHAPYTYPEEHGDIESVTVEATLRQATSRYTGVPIREIITQADPRTDAGLVLIEASDGYAFFVTMAEVQANDSLILAVQGRGDEASYHVVGAESSKAWVRNVTKMTVIASDPLPITGALNDPAPYRPATWQDEMDSTQINLSDGAGGRKLQGAPLGEVLASMNPQGAAATVVITSPDAEITLSLSEVLDDDGLRIFTVINEAAIDYAVARMEGELLAYPVTTIEVQ